MEHVFKNNVPTTLNEIAPISIPVSTNSLKELNLKLDVQTPNNRLLEMAGSSTHNNNFYLKEELEKKIVGLDEQLRLRRQECIQLEEENTSLYQQMIE